MSPSQAKAALSSSRIFDLRRLDVEQDGDCVVLRGRVDSFYHKQLAQELVRVAVDGAEVINAISVDLSSRPTRSTMRSSLASLRSDLPRQLRKQRFRALPARGLISSSISSATSRLPASSPCGIFTRSLRVQTTSVHVQCLPASASARAEFALAVRTMIRQLQKIGDDQAASFQRVPKARRIADAAERRDALSAQLAQLQRFAAGRYEAAGPMRQLQPHRLRRERCGPAIRSRRAARRSPRRSAIARPPAPGQARHRLAQQARAATGGRSRTAPAHRAARYPDRGRCGDAERRRRESAPAGDSPPAPAWPPRLDPDSANAARPAAARRAPAPRRSAGRSRDP